MKTKTIFLLLLLSFFYNCATKPQARKKEDHQSSKNEPGPEKAPDKPAPTKSWYLTDGNLTRCYEGALNYGDKLKAQNAGIKFVEKEGACSSSYLKKKEIYACTNLQSPEPKSLVKIVFYEGKEIMLGKDEKVLTPEKVCDEHHGELN